MKIIVLRMGLPLSLILLAAATFVVAGAKGKGQSSARGYPKIGELLSENETLRTKAISQYMSTQEKLTEQLAQIVHPGTGKRLADQLRGSACFLLAQIRTSDRRAIGALIAAIREDFLPPVTSRMPLLSNPSGALIAIGKPAVVPVLDQLGKTKDKQKTALLRNVLQIIEGVDCAIVRIQAHIGKERDSKKKARLEMTLKYFEDKKADLRKK